MNRNLGLDMTGYRHLVPRIATLWRTAKPIPPIVREAPVQAHDTVAEPQHPVEVKSTFKFHRFSEHPAGLHLLLFGPCAILPLIDAAIKKSVRIDHLAMLVDDHRNTHFDPPLDTISGKVYDANIITFPLRAIMANGGRELGGAGNDVFWPRIALTEDIAAYFDGCVDLLKSQIHAMDHLLGARPTFFLSFWAPRRNFLGNLFPKYSLSNPSWFVQRLNQAMSEIIAAWPNTYLVDVNEILDSLGRDRLQDDYVRELAHASNMFDTTFEDDSRRLQPGTPVSEIYDLGLQPYVFGEKLLDLLLDNIQIIRQDNPIKLIIMDLDDTLWRGVLADSDRSEFERIDFWPLGVAEALLVFKARGGMLAICSKNDETLATAEFNRVWRGKLKLEDFVSVKINFESKSKNIEDILDEVNILPKNALFIDDNPREIDEVASVIPDLKILSKEHNDWRRAILLSPETQVATVTQDSKRRTELVRAKIARDQTKASISREDWLKSLEIEQRYQVITSVNDPHFTRSFELLNKTNQFNTTGKRWTSEEITAHLADGGYLFCCFLKDKTVDNGMISVHVIKENIIVQTVLSCRVFGLFAEYAAGHIICAHILERHGRIRGWVQDTGRNFSSHQYFARMGFTVIGEGVFEITHAPPHPNCVHSVTPIPWPA